MTQPSSSPPCPECHSGHVVRNGLGKLGQQSYRCTGCERRFVPPPAKGPVSEATQALVVRRLGERVSLRGIARATGVSRSWLQAFVNAPVSGRHPLAGSNRRPPPPRKKAGGRDRGR